MPRLQPVGHRQPLFAREFGKDNIRVNAIMPGWVLTPRQMELWASPDFHLPPAYYELNELMSPVMGPRGDAIRSRMRQLRAVEGFALRQVEHRGAVRGAARQGQPAEQGIG